MKSLNEYISESFTYDDDVIYQYCDIFKSKIPQDDLTADMQEFEMWDSIGKDGKEYVLKHTAFTGFINDDIRDLDHDNRTHEYLEILKQTNKKDIFDYLSDEIDNHLDSVFGNSSWKTTPDGYYNITIKYDDEVIRIQDYDWENSEHIYPNHKWNQQIDRNPRWIIDASNGRYWTKSDIDVKDLSNYLGMSYYKNGKFKF